jgi:hypothetical protein
MKILIYFTVILEIGAAILIAEIDNFNNFSGDKLAFWLGIVQDIYKY